VAHPTSAEEHVPNHHLTRPAAATAPGRSGTAPAGGPWCGDRAAWTTLADRLLASARRYASPGHARITLPGVEGGYGRDVDGLEGFARTFLLAGFRLAGERGVGLDELADWYAAGIADGTDPASPHRWVRLTEHGQAKVEAASIALTLDLTRPWIWDRLAPSVRERVVEYLSPAVGDATYPRINWVWFRLVVQTFLRSVGGPSSASDMAEDLATHDSFGHAGGWLSDGPTRAFDHYTGWALHLYPALWARMSGVADLAAGARAAGPLAALVAGRRERDVAALDAYLRDAVALVGADGSPLLQGRSLIYRFAAAAPFWAGALSGVPSLSPGQLRHAASRIVGHFVTHGAPDASGLLSIGWHGPWRRLAQSYSGPGSPYWAANGMVGLLLPADHPVWTDEAVPLPVEAGDVLRALPAPGWLVAGTREDGIVRVVNHGTDHAVEGAALADSPLYARLGYSTATCPVLDDSGWRAPVDQSVVLVDAAGATTHRTGMRTLTLRVDDCAGSRVAVGASTGPVHWVDAGAGGPDHGEGRPGPARPAARITVVSLLRGAWEIRLCRLDDLKAHGDQVGWRLRVGGWPVTAGLTCRVVSLLGDGAAGVTVHEDAGPLGSPVRVSWLDHAVRPGTWVAALIELSAGDAPPELSACRVELDAVDGSGLDVRVEWPDRVRTRTRIDPRTPTGSRTGDR
jgi:hypothetical protein